MYSQNEEEAAILQACAGIDGGRFLDIGAWHHSQFSNTRALYEKGWRGVLVEPAPGPLKELVREYGGVHGMYVIGAAVGVAPEVRPLQITDDALSTTEVERAKEWDSIAKYYGSLWVPFLTVRQILEQFRSEERRVGKECR